MITCPLCEHRQEGGDECQACGRRLSGPGAVPVPIPRLEGLEPTTLLEHPADVPPDLVPGLEPTLHAAVEVAAATAAEIEPTRAAPVEVAVEEAPGLERTAADPVPGDARAEPPPAPVCRYCRTPALPGEVICGRCGMKLPVLAGAGAPPPPAEEARCPACGTVSVGSICSGCGTLLRHG